jgi:RNA polymerase sigma-B factor
MPLAESLARRYRRSSEPREDLEQVACLALVKAVDAFDVDRGTAFSSYAVPCISGAIKRYFRDHGWAVRVPRELQELALRIQRLDERHFGEAGRHATATELAAAAGVDVEDILEAREAQRALYSDSIDQRRQCEEDDDASLLDTLGESDPEFDRAADRAALDAVLAQLDDRRRLIVELYYRDELTQAEIGRRIGCSQMHVSRLLRAAVAQMQAIAPSENRVGLGRAA